MTNRMNVIIGGDVSTKNNKEFVDREYCENLLRDMTPLLESVDFRIINLENPICEDKDCQPIIKTGPNLYGYPKNIGFFNVCKADCAVLANNHFGDMGDGAIVSTLNVLKENNIAPLGGGMNKEEAYKAWYAEKDGVRVAFIAVCENEFGCATDTTPGSAGFEMLLLRDRIAEEKKNSDFVVVIFHGGNEKNPLPAPATIERYRLIIDLGADALVGAHTHCMQGYETYEGKPIIYSMGNFFFAYYDEKSANDNPWNYGYLTEFIFEKGKNVEFKIHPYALLNKSSWLHLLDGEDKEIILSYVKKISDIIQDKVAIQDYFDAWCTTSGIAYSRAFEKFSREFFNGEITDAAMKNDVTLIRNLFSCEAHNFLLTNLFRMAYEGRLEKAKALLPELLELQKIPKISLS